MSNQAETLAFLASKAAFGSDDASCETIVTHISTVLLLGNRAIKIKRSLCLPYLDFSTPELRLAACLDELRLNQRTAPQMYRAVHRITREADGRLAVDGRGELEDAVVEMLRFDGAQLFDRMAHERRLTVSDTDRLAGAIAKLHAEEKSVICDEGATRFGRILTANEEALWASQVFTSSEIIELTDGCRAAFEQLEDLIDRRARAGFIKRCHGDLHLGNICMVDGMPTLFDCLEFNEEMATIDVLYDLAFVLMDLWRHDLRLHANILFNRYLDVTGDETGIPLMPLFMAVRAVIRAHVAACEVGTTEQGAASKREEALSILALARDLLSPRPPMLIAIGGYSGSGKSSVAMRIAPDIGPVPGARVLSSDRIRKQLFGVAAITRLAGEAYAAPISDTVYALISTGAARVLASGHGVVADAVFDRPAARTAISQVASDWKLPFRPLWLEAPAEVLMRRVAARTDDPSDATPDIVMAQLFREQTPVDWPRLCAVGDLRSVCEAALSIIHSSPDEPTSAQCHKMRVPSRSSTPLTCAHLGLPRSQAPRLTKSHADEIASSVPSASRVRP